MIIVDLIKELMDQQNKSVEDMVILTKLTYREIYNIVAYDVIPNPENAKIILGVLGVNLEDVLTLY